MNRGGFSWRRFVGISAFKSKISRAIGIPLTASGRRRKLGAAIFNAVGPLAGAAGVAAVAVAQHRKQKRVAPPSVLSVQAEARQLGWTQPFQSFCYCENEYTELYQILPVHDNAALEKALQAGLRPMGILGWQKAPKGFEWQFATLDGVPTDGPLARRFMVHAHEWVVTESTRIAAQNKVAPPVVHGMQFTSRFAREQAKGERKKGFHIGLKLGVITLVVALFNWKLALAFLVVPLVVALARRN